MNPPKAERAKPSLSSDYNLLFKNKIGESSLDIHREHKTALFGWLLKINPFDQPGVEFAKKLAKMLET